MNAKIIVYLTEAGRKADILAGGMGQQVQEIVLERDHPAFARVVALGEVKDTGVVLETRYSGTGRHYTPPWDAIPTAEQVLECLASRAAAERQAEEERKAKIRADTLAVLAERKTTERGDFEDGQSYTYRVAAWPYPVDRSVVESPEAVSWLAELEEARLLAIDGAKQRAVEAKQKAELEAQQKAAKLEAFRALLGVEDAQESFKVEEGCLARVPCWESHSRGKNWLAVIVSSPTSPGGLRRDFAVKAKGDLYYVLPDLSPGDALEFGADYYTGGGRKNGKRWYGYFVRLAIHPESGNVYAILCECGTGKQAIKEGAAFAAQVANEKPAADAASAS